MANEDLRHVKGLAELTRFMQDFPGKLQKNVLRGGFRVGAQVVAKEAGVNLQRKNAVHTGILLKGIKVSTRVKGQFVIASVKSGGPHGFVGNMLEFTGAKPHTIHPSIAKDLFFNGIARASVDHPGFRPKPYLRPALDARAQDALVAIANYMKIRLQTKHGIDTADVEVGAV